MIGGRKDWLTSGMEERKRRRELGMPEIYLYGKDTRTVSYTDFVNKELILFSNADNERSIPSLVDGKSISSVILAPIQHFVANCLVFQDICVPLQHVAENNLLAHKEYRHILT